jgi:hypothetical protein
MRERSATKMTSPSDTGGGRGTSYEKMLVADTFLIIGCILLSFGLGLSFYNVPINAQDSVTTLDASNTYSQNLPIHLDSGDVLVLGVKPYALANVSLLLVDANFQIILTFQTIEPGALLNFTYNAGSSGNYVIQVFENLTDPANRAVICQLEAMSVVFLASPSRPYIFYGLVVILVGIALLFFSRRASVRMRYPGRWNEPKSYILPSILLVSTIGFSALLSTSILNSSIQLGTVGDALLVAFSALNICALLLGITTLQDKPLMVFLRTLLLSVAIWFVSLTILVILLPSVYLESSPYWDLGVFLTSMEGIATMNQAFSQIVTLVVILVIAYCLSYRYGKHRIYSYQVETELVDAGTLKELLRELEGAIGRKDLREFFGKLRDKDLEASVFLFYVLSDHARKGINSFTYHSIIVGRRDVFSKDIYERDPAQKILKPLGFLRVSGAGRFKRHRLRTNEPVVGRLISLFKEAIGKGEIDTLSKHSGVDLLKERRMRYAGELKDHNQSPEEL